ncbi:MAG: hypothetical protein NC548_38135 [Lachnospiraceae bacterium]|nr:hypothetical protein [Lachnospiraceae bacterium]
MNKSEIFKSAWRMIKLDKVSKSEALKAAWRIAKGNKVELISDNLGLNSIYHLSWEQVKAYMSQLSVRTRTFYSIAKAVYQHGKFSTHRSEFNALYHSVAK